MKSNSAKRVRVGAKPNDRVEQYRHRLAECFLQAQSSWRWIHDALHDLCRTLDDLEWEMQELIQSFNSPARQKDNGWIKLVWVYHTGNGVRGALDVHTADKRAPTSGRPVHIERLPFRKEISRRAKKQFIPYQMAAVARIRYVRRLHKTLRNDLSQCLTQIPPKALHGPGMTRQIMGSTLAKPEILAEQQQQRRIQAEQALMEFDRITGQLSRIDQQLEQEIARFNQVKKTRKNGHLVCAWELDGTNKEKWLGPTGPTFFTISYHGGSRRRLRVKTGVAGVNKITAKLVQDRHLGRYQKPYLEHGQRIDSLRSQRKKLHAPVLALAKRLHRYHKTKETL
jgi:hypothetical protein